MQFSSQVYGNYLLVARVRRVAPARGRLPQLMVLVLLLLLLSLLLVVLLLLLLVWYATLIIIIIMYRLALRRIRSRLRRGRGGRQHGAADVVLLYNSISI